MDVPSPCIPDRTYRFLDAPDFDVVEQDEFALAIVWIVLDNDFVLHGYTARFDQLSIWFALFCFGTNCDFRKKALGFRGMIFRPIPTAVRYYPNDRAGSFYPDLPRPLTDSAPFRVYPSHVCVGIRHGVPHPFCAKALVRPQMEPVGKPQVIGESFDCLQGMHRVVPP